MHLRHYQPSDQDALVALAIDTFGPFFEQSLRSLLGERILAHQHGSWQEDYRRELPTLHDPEQGRHVLLAVVGEDVVGFVSWRVDVERRHGEITHLATGKDHRRQGVAGALFDAAVGAMRRAGTDVVALGTGGEWFHEPARAFYERKGMRPVPGVYYFKELRP